MGPSAQDTLIQFRTPDFDDGLLAGETIEDSNKPVSFFYVDVYGGYKVDVDTSELLRRNPCVMMEPSYALVRDEMTFYGTCNYHEMFQLNLNLSNGTWNAAVTLSRNYRLQYFADDFELSWQGINHKVISNISYGYVGSAVVQLLLHKQSMNVQDVRSIYPDQLSETRLPDISCKCLDGSRFDYRKRWLELSPKTNETEEME